MNPRPLEEAKDPDIRNSLQALQRAAQRAREIAIQTGTGIIIQQDNKIWRITFHPKAGNPTVLEEEYELLRTLTPSPPASGREN